MLPKTLIPFVLVEVVIAPKMKILVIMDITMITGISVLEFYGYIDGYFKTKYWWIKN